MSFVEFVALLKQRNLLTEMREVCQKRRVMLAEAWGTSKFNAPTDARAACWARLRELGLSYPEIGMLWGRDHATVLRAVKRFGARNGTN